MGLFEVCKASDFIVGEFPRGKIRTAIVAGNGLFEHKTGYFGESVKKVGNYSSAGQPNLVESVTLTEDKEKPKIPFEAILYTIHWYRQATLSRREEAQINFYRTNGKCHLVVDGKEVHLRDIEGVTLWNDEVFSYVPKQYNSGTLTDVAAEDEYYDELNKQFGMYVETHSHNSMSAFASGTDIANSQNDGIQLVFGRLDKEIIQMHSWFTIRDVTREFIRPEELAMFLDEDFCNLLSVGEDKKYYIPLTQLPSITKEMTTKIEVWESRCLERPTPQRKYIGFFDKDYPIDVDYRQMDFYDEDINPEHDESDEDEMDEDCFFRETNPHLDRAAEELVMGIKDFGYTYRDGRVSGILFDIANRAYEILRREEHKW